MNRRQRVAKRAIAARNEAEAKAQYARSIRSAHTGPQAWPTRWRESVNERQPQWNVSALPKHPTRASNIRLRDARDAYWERRNRRAYAQQTSPKQEL